MSYFQIITSYFNFSVFDQRLLWWYLPLSLQYNVKSYDLSGKDFFYRAYLPHPTNRIRVSLNFFINVKFEHSVFRKIAR